MGRDQKAHFAARETLADAQGLFTFTDIPRGATVRVRMERDDLYCRRDRSPTGTDIHLVRVVWPADHADASVKVLRLDQAEVHVQLEASPGYTIFGRVVDEKGAGIPDALVRLGSGTDHQILEVRSGPDGHYRIGCLRVLKKVRLSASRVGYRTTETREDLSAESEGAFEVKRDLTMARGGAIRAIAYSSDGLRARGLRIGIAPEGERIEETRAIETNEAVTFDGLVPGRAYRVFLLEKSFPKLPLSVSEKITPHDEVLEVELSQPPRGKVHVQVNLERFPDLTGGRVFLYHSHTHIELGGSSWGLAGQNEAFIDARLDEFGRCEFTVPAIGGWRVLVLPFKVDRKALVSALDPRDDLDIGPDAPKPSVLGTTVNRLPSHGEIEVFLDEPLVAAGRHFEWSRKAYIQIRPVPASGVVQKEFTRALKPNEPLSTALLWPGRLQYRMVRELEGSRAHGDLSPGDRRRRRWIDEWLRVGEFVDDSRER
jgi:Carboxypeptidase regulatory-like domain